MANGAAAADTALLGKEQEQGGTGAARPGHGTRARDTRHAHGTHARDTRHAHGTRAWDARTPGKVGPWIHVHLLLRALLK